MKQTWFSNLFNWYFSKNALPYWAVLIVDCIILMFAGFVAAYITEGGSWFINHFWTHTLHFAYSLPFFLVGMKLFHTYSGVLRYSSFVDLVNNVLSTTTGIVGIVIFELIFPDVLFIHDLICNWSFPLIWLVTSVLILCGMRIAIKMIFDTTSTYHFTERVYIFGVREGGLALAKSMRSEHPMRYLVKGFVSHEPEMQGHYLLGCNVHALDENIVASMIKDRARKIFVSPLFADVFRANESIVNKLIQNGIHIMMMPVEQAWDGKSDLRHEQLHEVDIEDLLPRDKIQVDLKAIGELLNDKCILITGAAGSIGSEMVRQVAKFTPKQMVLVDQAETPMHDVRRYMAQRYPDLPCETIVSSISNQTHMESIFSKYRPEYVFHAAAYKHVPMMEDNPAMAIQNNTYGTRVIADLAVKYGTKKFVMISTDKAVNPTNVMGCSKRICEIYCQSLNKAIQDNFEGIENVPEGFKGAKTQFITTRFGNVLGSNGSVIPIFKEQIKKGGPITVTHPDIIRFFMLIPEACQLVLEAGTMGHGGEIFVFDMGKPVRIADLAQRMIDLSGAKDVQIKFTGLRDGEKLYEEVLSDAEKNKPTSHPKIMVASVREYNYEEALRNEEELHRLSFTYDDMAIVAKMKDIVPEYKSKQSKYEALDK